MPAREARSGAAVGGTGMSIVLYPQPFQRFMRELFVLRSKKLFLPLEKALHRRGEDNGRAGEAQDKMLSRIYGEPSRPT